jgi:hypothetical protein
LAEEGIPALIEIGMILNIKVDCKCKSLHCEWPNAINRYEE